MKKCVTWNNPNQSPSETQQIPMQKPQTANVGCQEIIDKINSTKARLEESPKKWTGLRRDEGFRV